MTTKTTIDINNSLSQRGILVQAQLNNWQATSYHNQAGWAYPILDPITGETIAQRWKAAPSTKNTMKYSWMPSKPNHPAANWYILPDTVTAIQAAQGICYLANGEPALLAYHAAGIHNVIATTLSEIAVPNNVLSMLQQLNISRLLYPVDNDRAGEQSAIKWRDALRGSGIDFVALSWGEDAPPKADANDIWIAVNFNKSAFKVQLSATIELKLPIPAPIQAQNSFNTDDFDQTPQGLIDALASALGVRGWRSNGWASKNISSPFREDQHPSATFHRDSGVLHDFGTGESYSPTQVADALGIDWRSFYPRRPKKSKKAQISTRSMQNWAENVTLPTYTATLQVNQRYISDLSSKHFQHRTLRIKSPLATGKTELIARIIADFKAREGKEPTVLVQTHQQALVNNIAKRLGIYSYLDVPRSDNARPYIDLMPQLAITYDSLHLVSGRQFDLVFIDEFEQNMAHLTGGTMNGQQARTAYETLSELLRGAGQVMVADAHLSDNLKNWLMTLRGEEDFVSIENTYRHAWDELTLYADKSNLVAHALKQVQQVDQPIVITANSRTETEILGKLFADALGESAVFVINGWNSNHNTRRNFISNINQQISSKKVVICSPTLGTGIDVQAPVAAVYGIFSRDTWGSATTIMQQMMRFRNAGERHLYVQPIFAGNEETDAHNIYHRHIARTQGTTQAAKFSTFNTPQVDLTDRSILMIESIQRASRAIQRNDLFSYTVGYAKDEGFTLAYNEDTQQQMSQNLRDLRQSLKDDAREKTLSLPAISRDQFERLLQRGEVKRETYYQQLRGKIEATAGQTITGDLYDLLHTSRQRADFNRFLDLHQPLADLQERDREQAQSYQLISQRGHFTHNMQLIIGALQSVFGKNWHLSTQELTASDIEQRLTLYLAQHLLDIQTYIDRRTDLSTDPVALLRRMLKRVALVLHSEQKRVNGERVRFYSLDRDHLATMRNLASIALAAYQGAGQGVSEHVSIASDKRDLRPTHPNLSNNPEKNKSFA